MYQRAKKFAFRTFSDVKLVIYQAYSKMQAKKKESSREAEPDRENPKKRTKKVSFAKIPKDVAAACQGKLIFNQSVTYHLRPNIQSN